jgi:probable addiction module antidote protein
MCVPVRASEYDWIAYASAISGIIAQPVMVFMSYDLPMARVTAFISALPIVQLWFSWQAETSARNKAILFAQNTIGRTIGSVKMATSKNYQDSLLESLTDASEAAAYLNAALEDGDNEVFLLALRNVADARLGGMSKLANATGLNRESLYRMLSDNGNPELNSLSRLLQALGLKLAVEKDNTAA